MHGSNPLEIRDAKEALALRPRRGFRNLLGTPSARFTGGGILEGPDGVNELTKLMRRLTGRKISPADRFWPSPLDPVAPRPEGAEPIDISENPGIPSGYTYLLQLVAHDLVASTVSLSVGTARAAVENVRGQALMLDTIYGSGPDLTPDAYEFGVEHRDSNGLVPRTRLRLGPLRPLIDGATHCIHRDIGRGTGTAGTENCRFARDVVAAKNDAVTFGMIECDAADRVEDAGRGTTQQKLWRTEALLADGRNDSHALLSQLTALFHLLHNTLMDKIESTHPHVHGAASAEAPQWSPSEVAWRRFLCVRLAVTLIYRRIIRNDLMRRLLHKDVYAAYMGGLRLESPGRQGVPLEFSHGAFRCGHAMVRNSYRTNRPEQEPLETTRGLFQSRRYPHQVPVTKDWLLDWRLFFEIDPTIVPNYSGRLGPRYASAMFSEAIPAPGPNLGLPYFDHISAAFAGVWSVPALFDSVKSKLPNSPLADIFITYDLWRAPFSNWLGEEAGRGHLSENDRERLAKDPPLSLFVLFEAAHVIEGRVPVRKGGGARLGLLGSIIVAETIFGALDDNPVPFEDESTLSDAMACCCHEVLCTRSALADVCVPAGAGHRDIDEMQDLILFLSESGAFPLARD